jgi:hypothetical protein
MADLPSSFSKVNDVEVAQDGPVSEALFDKLGSNDNYLKDNLDAEITNRAAGDAAITADINTNVKGAGPTQTLTQLKARVENAKNVGVIYTVTRFVDGDLGWGGGYTGAGPRSVCVTRQTNFIVRDTSELFGGGIVQNGSTFDTGVAVAANRFAELTWDFTTGSGGQYVFTLIIYQIDPV